MEKHVFIASVCPSHIKINALGRKIYKPYLFLLCVCHAFQVRDSEDFQEGKAKSQVGSLKEQ